MSDYHTSVLLDECMKALQPVEGKRFVDGTLGGGGHTFEMLDFGAEVIGFDRDPEALVEARARCWAMIDRFIALQGNFATFGDILDEVGISKVDGVLLDLGVSSHQLDEPERGFSFQADGPLDMRMGPDIALTAADLVNREPESELKRIFREFGEERSAGKIARAILKRRETKKFETTLDLADFITTIKNRTGRAHPATKVFQALRIAVNDELGSLERGLEAASRWLAPGGRLAVITFHSLEDRIVKRFMKQRSREFLDRPEWPAPKPNPDHAFKLVSRKPILPSDTEIAANPRARSAKLRVAERI